ncbi:MAG: hypothetical protein M3Y42_14490 [Actinomycetota bacterium]|nr:hypothetical protein [Actinomycetota bacterium]MDQ2958158.1 hypothetical protein [Actinomycetota bacterium]
MLKDLPGRSGPIRRFSAAVAVTAAGALLLAGCAAGQHAQTVGQQPAIDGVSATSGDISVQTAGIMAPSNGPSYAKGGSALLQLVVVNNGATDGKLVAVSSTLAGAGQVSNAGPPTAASATPAVASASASVSASVSASAAPSATGSPIAGSGNTPIDLPAGQSVQVGYSTAGPNISLDTLTGTLFPAQTVPVTFTFLVGSAGSTVSTLTVNLPVQLLTDGPSAPVISAATQPAE